MALNTELISRRPVGEFQVRLLDEPPCPVKWFSIVGRQHSETHRWPWPETTQIPDRDETAEGLGHLLALDLLEAVVHPVVRHHRRAKPAARLRDLVLVVREHEVDAATVDVAHVRLLEPRL